MCLTELIARGEERQSLDSAGSSLVVLRDGSRMELAVVCQRQLIAAHAVKWSSASEIPGVVKMLAEVSRVLVQVQAWLPQGTLQRAWVIGEESDVGELPQAIGQRWKCPVQRFDPWRDAGISLGAAKLEGPASQYAIAAGLALVQTGSITPKIDLLHPRQPPPKRDPRKPIIAAASAAGLLVAALGTASFQQLLASYDSTIKDLRNQESKLKSEIDSGKPIVEASKSIEDWQSKNVNQLNQMDELYQLMKGTDRLLVGEYSFDVGTANVIGKLHAIGNAKEREDVERFSQRLADLPKYRVRPPSNATDRSFNQDYPSRAESGCRIDPCRQKAANASNADSDADEHRQTKKRMNSIRALRK